MTAHVASPEVRLLLLLGRTYPAPADEASRLFAVVDGERFATLADNHRLSPIVLDRAPDGALAPPLRKRLRASAEAFQVLNLRLVAMGLDALARLEEAGIRVLLLKGPATALALYGTLSTRPFRDIDLWVEPGAFPRAKQLLLAAGFATPPSQDARQIGRRWTHHEELSRDGLLLELHSRLPLWPGATRPMDFDQAWSRRREQAFGARRAAVLGEEDAALYLFAHGSDHRWARLRWLVDAAVLLGAAPGPDWDAVRQAAGTHGCRRAVRLGMTLAARCLDAPNPLALDLEPLAEACPPLWEIPDAEQSDTGSIPYRIRLADDARGRARALAAGVFRPHPPDWDALPFIPPRTPLVFSVVRPVRLAARLAAQRLRRRP